jgi:hypothetical protein
MIYVFRFCARRAQNRKTKKMDYRSAEGKKATAAASNLSRKPV